MADNDIQHRPTQYADQNTVSALSQMQQQNADKWRSVNVPNQFNQPNYSPSYTGNPLVDAGIALAGQKAFQLAGGQGTPRFITPYAPGTSQMMMDMAANQIGPMRQSMMQQFNRQIQPITGMGLQAMSDLGFGKQANQIRQAMGSSPFLTDLAALANQTPLLQTMMGGNIFRGQNELLNRAASFGVGGPPAFSPQMMMQRNVAQMSAANDLGQAIMERTYRDPGTGKFNLMGNAGYTGGWKGEDMQRLGAEMAARNVSQPAVGMDGRIQMMGMSNMHVDAGMKAEMVGRMGRAMAGVATATGISDPVEALRMVQQNLGGGRNSRNMNSIAAAATQLATIGGAAQAFGLDPASGVGIHQAVLAGANMRMSLMADPSGNTPRAGSSMARAMASSATMNAMAEAGATGARTPEDLSRLASKYGSFTMDKMNSNEFRETSLAMRAMATNPALAARYGGELQQSMMSGNTTNTRRIVQDMSQVMTGSRGGIASIASNNKEYADHMERYERKLVGMGKSPEEVDRYIMQVANAADKKETMDASRRLNTKTVLESTRSYVGRAGITVSQDDLANRRKSSILSTLGELRQSGRITTAEFKRFTEMAQEGGAKGLQKLQSAMQRDPNYQNYRKIVEEADQMGQTNYYADKVGRDRTAGGYSAKWQNSTISEINAAATTPEGKAAWAAKKKELMGEKDLRKRGEALDKYVMSGEFDKINGNTPGSGNNLRDVLHKRLNDERGNMKTQRELVMQANTDMQDKRTAKIGNVERVTAALFGLTPPQEDMVTAGGRANAWN